MLSDYVKLNIKAYYAKQMPEKVWGKAILHRIADSLKKSADAERCVALRRKIKRRGFTKKVKSFIDDYNDVVKEAGESNTKDVLRNASWMTGMTDKTSHLLSKIGITIGKGNKLELDEDELKKADISSLKTVFTGYNSFAGKTAQKATGISNAANRASATYTNNGTYSKHGFLSNVK